MKCIFIYEIYNSIEILNRIEIKIKYTVYLRFNNIFNNILKIEIKLFFQTSKNETYFYRYVYLFHRKC